MNSSFLFDKSEDDPSQILEESERQRFMPNENSKQEKNNDY
jgi:hypothetical protein